MDASAQVPAPPPAPEAPAPTGPSAAVESFPCARPEQVEAFVQAGDVAPLPFELDLTGGPCVIIINSNVKLRACFAIWVQCDDKGSE